MKEYRTFPLNLPSEDHLGWGPKCTSSALKSPHLQCRQCFCPILTIERMNLPRGCSTTVLSSCLSFHRKSLDLVESLLRLSELGQYEQVKQLFGFPIKHCPDMLVLALLQISTSWHTLRHELISTLMPIFLGNHPNSAIILHYAWHGQVANALYYLCVLPSLGWTCVSSVSFNLDEARFHGYTISQFVLLKYAQDSY